MLDDGSSSSQKLSRPHVTLGLVVVADVKGVVVREPLMGAVGADEMVDGVAKLLVGAGRPLLAPKTIPKIVAKTWARAD